MRANKNRTEIAKLFQSRAGLACAYAAINGIYDALWFNAHTDGKH